MIKKEWKSRLELGISDLNKRFRLETNASNTGLGAVLLQDGKRILYISRLLSNSERNYSITEKEVLAALWAIQSYSIIG